jgi:phosphoketolase
MPDFRNTPYALKQPGSTDAEATRVMGRFLRDVMKLNLQSKNFRLFSPDEKQFEPLAGCAGGHEPCVDGGAI